MSLHYINSPITAHLGLAPSTQYQHSLADALLALCSWLVSSSGGCGGGSGPLSEALEANSGLALGPFPTTSRGIPPRGLAIWDSCTGASNIKLMQIQLRMCTQPKREKEKEETQ